MKRLLYCLAVLSMLVAISASVSGQAATETPAPTTVTATPEAPATETPEGTATAEPCFVSTETARTATVRVGPGTNRTALFFLATDKSYTVAGVNVLEGESVWFKLVKEEIDPDSGALEMWIAAADVEQTGDCENVGATAAPPIIPILNSAAAANAQVNKTVTGGEWRIYFAEKFIYSCVNDYFRTTTREAQTVEIQEKLEWGANLTFATDHRSFTMTGEWADYILESGATITFILTADNRFTAVVTQTSGKNFTYNVTLVNENLITGDDRYHWTVGETKCSETVRFEIRRG